MPEGIAIGPLFIHFYGVIIMCGVIMATWLARHEAGRVGQDPEAVLDMLVWVLVGGVVGARIWHILTPPPTSITQGITTYYYLTHPLDSIAIWKGGLGIPGAIVGGTIAVYFYTRRYGLPFFAWLDILAPGLALAQAVGRWGNFVNQELYGAPTNLPWAITIDPQHRMLGFENYGTYHPLFLYESLWNLANMTFLLWLSRHFEKRLRPGDVLSVYLIVYPVGRFLLDFLRLDASRVAGVNANQTLMVVVALISAAILFLRHSPWRKFPSSNQ